MQQFAGFWKKLMLYSLEKRISMNLLWDHQQRTPPIKRQKILGTFLVHLAAPLGDHRQLRHELVGRVDWERVGEAGLLEEVGHLLLLLRTERE